MGGSASSSKPATNPEAAAAEATEKRLQNNPTMANAYNAEIKPVSSTPQAASSEAPAPNASASAAPAAAAAEGGRRRNRNRNRNRKSRSRKQKQNKKTRSSRKQ